jgi:predicted AAA+ superfamily ATPase
MSINGVSDNIKVLIETAKYIITGKLVIQDDITNYPSVENILFTVLNSGNKFLTLHDCYVSRKEQAEYQPERIEYFHVNLDIVHTCRVLKDM